MSDTEQEPSMEEILASIRRIISDDDKEMEAAAQENEEAPEDEEELAVEEMVAEPETEPEPEPEPEPQPQSRTGTLVPQRLPRLCPWPGPAGWRGWRPRWWSPRPHTRTSS